MSKSTTTSISLPLPLEKELEKEAKAEHRTKSGLIQEAIRYYLENKRWKKLQQDIAHRAARAGVKSEDDVEALIDEIRN
jgi:metal-responsive CopG/Arc/MetJ family transcriptional regulator